jgi:tetratricopeptide (TPR) repeat protein
MSADPILRRYQLAGVVATAVIVLVAPLSLVKQQHRTGVAHTPQVGFVGRQVCEPCHTEATEAWRGSDHDKAMDVVTEDTVLGDFDDVTFDDGHIAARFFRRDGAFMVATAGPDGEIQSFEITHTFGIKPLQQYLIPFPGGRYQCLTIAWDTVRSQWFNLYPGQDIPPDDWLHWTQAAQTWNGMCAECHSTNLKKGYDYENRTFDTTFSEIDVSCEACHGPGSEHVEWAEIPPMARPQVESFGLVIKTREISARDQVELCAPCHSRRSELGDYDHTSGALLHSLVPAVLEEQLYHADGQILGEVYVYGSYVQSKMFKNDVRCSDCHDVHSLKRRLPGNQLCGQCHRADVYDSSAHHFHKKVYQGRPSDGALCIKCHMPEQPYMVRDWRADHSIRVPRPDLTEELGVPNACSHAGCHDDKPLSWVIDAHERWYGRARKPHYGTILAAGRAGDESARPQLIGLAGDPLYPSIVRATALTLLRPYSDAETVNAFNRALSDEEDLVRYTAVLSLIADSPERTVELLVPMLFDPVQSVRMQAAARLAGAPEELLQPYQRQALASAIGEYEQAMQYSLDFAFAGHNLGNLYTRLGRIDRAERSYRAAIAVDNLFSPAKVNLATLLNTQGHNREAESLLREVLEAEPENAEVSYSLGLLLAELERYEEAARFIEGAANGMPERARVFYNLGLVYRRLSRPGPAEMSLKRAVELEPENLDFLYALADHHLALGQLSDAIGVAERMIAIHPEQQLGHDVKAYVEQAIGAGGNNP